MLNVSACSMMQPFIINYNAYADSTTDHGSNLVYLYIVYMNVYFKIIRSIMILSRYMLIKTRLAHDEKSCFKPFWTAWNFEYRGHFAYLAFLIYSKLLMWLWKKGILTRLNKNESNSMQLVAKMLAKDSKQ